MNLNNALGFEVESLEQRMLLDRSGLPEFDANSGGLYQVFSDYGRLGQVDLENERFTVAETNAGTRVNAVGFRSADNYAYGIFSKTNHLARIGSNGEMQDLGRIRGLPNRIGGFIVGDFAGDGLLYVMSGKRRNVFFGIDVESRTVVKKLSTTSRLDNVFDMAYNPVDDTFYASRRGRHNSLVSINFEVNRGGVEVARVKKIGLNGLSKLTFGAMYADVEGNVFGAANQTGGVYRFDTTTGRATLVGLGPTSGANDGFSNTNVALAIPPMASDDFNKTDGLSIATGNVFEDSGHGEDLDGNFDELTVVALNGNWENIGRRVELESGAFVTLYANGDYEYDPGRLGELIPLGEFYKDPFHYTVSDGRGGEDTGKVTVGIRGVSSSNQFFDIHLNGVGALGSPGASIINVGDVNGDGFDDAMVGTPTLNSAQGASFLVYGTSSGIQDRFDIRDLFEANGGNGRRGTVFFGDGANDRFGAAIAGLGDINGDGIDDFGVSSPDADPNGVRNAGESYIVFGRRDGFGAEFSIATLKASNGGDGSAGFVAKGRSAHDLTGTAIAGVGDINADGFDDLGIAAQHADEFGLSNVGVTYIVFGTDQGFDAEFELAGLAIEAGGDGSDGIVIRGTKAHDLIGDFIQGGKDVNGDGIDDLLIAANRADTYRMVDAGASYLIFGDEELSELNLGDLMEDAGGDGSKGVVFQGSKREAQTGASVRLTGDINGDGIDDMLVGVGNPEAEINAIVYGSGEKPEPEIELIAFKSTDVYLDNFDSAEDVDDRNWDQYEYSATLHSSEGTQVTIWGDPHVVITIGGVTERFDIGYGAGSIRVDGKLTISWDTFEKSPDVFNGQPPLKTFTVRIRGRVAMQIDTTDGVNQVDDLTPITDAQLRKFARKLRRYAGDANLPLQRR